MPLRSERGHRSAHDPSPSLCHPRRLRFVIFLPTLMSSRSPSCRLNARSNPSNRPHVPDLTKARKTLWSVAVKAVTLANIAVPPSFDQSTSHWTFSLASGQFILTPFVRSLLSFSL